MFQKNPTRASTGQHQFSQIPRAEISRSVFDRSHGHKTTFDSGWLIPILIDDLLPGDTISMSMNMFARLATPLHPIMDNIYMDTFFFTVPYRLLWTNWERFNGAQDNPGDSTDFTIPQVQAPAVGGWLTNSMADYFGLPLGIDSMSSNALFFRAYNLVFNEWFRDENITNSRPKNMGDGIDIPGDYVLKRRAKRHDYFTSTLPFAQKGPAVELPLGTSAPVIPASVDPFPTFEANSIDNRVLSMQASSDVRLSGAAPPGDELMTWDTSGLVADLATATAATINALRQAFQIQKLYERDARGGTRYTEILRSHFQVTSPDQRLQRPEYLGGSSDRVEQSVVPQTAETGTTPQGHLTSYGVVNTNGAASFNKSIVEHSILIGLVSVRADLTYQQGMERMHSRNTRWDHFWPALQNIGEQAVLNKEIYMDGSAADDLVFGFGERWSEYRHKPSRITGVLRSNVTAGFTSLDSWHLAQDFDSLPALNNAFINETPPIDRVVAVTSEPEFIFDSYFNYKCVRPMPTYSVPGLIDHF